MSGLRIIVFAKAPEPGSVKTRLAPRLGADGAAALHKRLVERALATAAASEIGALELHCAPDTAHPFFAACASDYGVTLVPQTGHDLGERMFLASRDRIPAILIGSDCPALTPAQLQLAATRLTDGDDAVLAPTEDGGYALLGLVRSDRALFEGMPWSTDRVMGMTRDRLRALRWRWSEIETLWDVDRPEDYDRLVRSGLIDAAAADA